MNCRQDAVSYYAQTPETYLCLAEEIQRLTHGHDFSSGPMRLHNGYDIDAAILSDAARNLGAALLQFLTHNYLDLGGYATWAEVTRYYSRYFAVLAFTRLVGYASLWLDEWQDMHVIGGKQFYILRTDEQQHSYWIGLNKQLSKESEITLPFDIPRGSGSHSWTWRLMSEICKSWDKNELNEAAFPTPAESASCVDPWGSFEERMMDDLSQRGRHNYLGQYRNYFFPELNGLAGWHRPQGQAWPRYPNPFSDSIPDGDTCEHHVAWATIRYVGSVLARTSAAAFLKGSLTLIENAPANPAMKAKVISDMQSVLK